MTAGGSTTTKPTVLSSRSGSFGRHGRDDPRGLKIGGGQASRDARRRWADGITISVLEPAELDASLSSRRWGSIHGPVPATDPKEQYELFCESYWISTIGGEPGDPDIGDSKSSLPDSFCVRSNCRQ